MSPKAVASRADRPIRRSAPPDASSTPVLPIRSGLRPRMPLARALRDEMSPFLLAVATRYRGPCAPKRTLRKSIVEGPAPGRIRQIECIRPYSGDILHQLSLVTGRAVDQYHNEAPSRGRRRTDDIQPAIYGSKVQKMSFTVLFPSSASRRLHPLAPDSCSR